jgi:hypothetical protein
MNPGASDRGEEPRKDEDARHRLIVGIRARLNDGLGTLWPTAPNLESMNLARHAAVLWRFRRVTAAGLLLGIVLAVYASYNISPSGLHARGTSTYTSQSQLLVTQPGFPEGRSVLPTSPAVLGSTEEPKVDPDQVEFADPNRFLALADLYTKLIVSDEVLSRIPEQPSPAQITASPLPGVSGAPILPIIQVDTVAASPEAAQQLNAHTAEALRELLEQRQQRNDIRPAQSVQISTLKAPSPGVLATGPSRTSSILALLLCIIGTIAVTHLLENLRNRREAEALDDLDEWPAESSASEKDKASADLEAAFAGADWGPPTSATRRAE